MKKIHHISRELLRLCCLIAFVATTIILTAALFVQIFLDEQPCPLCLLQRAAFFSMLISLLMNFRYTNHSSHWALVIISACTGLAVSIRQICLHITSPIGFGSSFLGLHMYTWCFISFSVAILGSAFILLIYDKKLYTTNS